MHASNHPRRIIALVLSVLLFSGCASTIEAIKAVLGSSTKALEEARVEALSQTYACDYDQCFDAVIDLAKEKKLTVFIKDRKKSRIVLMGIPGSVDTTEVGVFFLSFGPQETKLEVASLSLSARDKVAEMVFENLSKAYSLVK